MSSVLNEFELTSSRAVEEKGVIPKSSTVRVLLVEDDEVDAQVVERALRGSRFPEYKIRHVRNLATAFKQVFNSSYDIILLDLGLPDGSDLNGLARLVSMLDVPIVVLTGNEATELAEDALSRGAHDFVSKAEDLSTILHRTVQFAVQRHHTQTALARTEQLLSVQGEFSKLQSAKIQQKLDSAERLAAFAQHTSQCVAIVSASGRIEWSNPSFEARCSAKTRDPENASLLDCLESIGLSQQRERIAEAIESGRPYRVCFTSQNNERSEQATRLELIPIHESESPTKRFAFSLVEEQFDRIPNPPMT